MIKQALIMKYIIIEDSTFGTYFDHWARVEFQRSLSAHIHMLISVDNDGINELYDEHGKLTERLAELVERTCTAKVSVCLIMIYVNMINMFNIHQL